MRIVFRADASVTIGTGHVMRCLTLAESLRAMGASCRFVCRDLPGHLGSHIVDRGFEIVLLAAPDGSDETSPPPIHAAWAGVPWQKDAAETAVALGRCDWLVLDHYAFDARWQRAVAPGYTRLMVIDDLADRPHEADILLDQNLGRTPGDYDGLVPDRCLRLIGPANALLRPEFAINRAAALAARVGRPLRHILISMGGVDLSDATSKVLDALCVARLPKDLRVTVVMGQFAPALDRVRSRALQMPWPTEVRINVRNMAELMATADIGIGAGGATTWERCCLGLPSIIVETADNQAGAVAAIVGKGAALGTRPLHDSAFASCLAEVVGRLADASLREEISRVSAVISSGDGADRIAILLGEDAWA